MIVTVLECNWIRSYRIINNGYVNLALIPMQINIDSIKYYALCDVLIKKTSLHSAREAISVQSSNYIQNLCHLLQLALYG